MSFANLICFGFLTALIVLFTFSKAQISLQPVQHFPRYTKFEASINSSYGEVLESSYRQFGMNGRQALNLHMVYYKRQTASRLNIQVSKCKEHYIDCYNDKTFDITNLCDNKKIITYFFKVGYVNQKVTCILNGEYIFKNITYSSDNLLPMLYSPVEKYWEQSIKWQLVVYNELNNVILVLQCHNEFITFRRRNPK